MFTSSKDLKGLRFVGSPAGPRRTLVVLVHGFGSRTERSWGRVPEFLAQDLRDDAYVATFSYSTGFNPIGTLGIKHLAEVLLRQVQEASEGWGYTQVSLTGHSMGGLVASLAAAMFLDDEVQQSQTSEEPLTLSGLLCVATPWEGALMAAPGIWVPQLRDLGPIGRTVRADARKGFERGRLWSLAQETVMMRDGVINPRDPEMNERRRWLPTGHGMAVETRDDSSYDHLRSWAKDSAAVNLRTYLRSLGKKVGQLGIRPIIPGSDQRLFSPRSATRWGPAAMDNPEDSDLAARRSETDHIDDIMAVLTADDPYVFLTGEGGAGKSTVIIELARLAIHDALDSPNPNQVPVLVRLNAIEVQTAPRGGILEALDALRSVVVDGAQVSELIGSGRATGQQLLVLADGLDEAHPTQRAWIDDIMRTTGRVRIIAAGRTESVDRSGAIWTLRLDRLSPDAANDIAQRFLGDLAGDFTTWVAGADSSLLEIPGQLEMLMRMWHGESAERGAPPRTLGALFDRVLPYMFGRPRDAEGTLVSISEDERNNLTQEAKSTLPPLAWSTLVEGVELATTGLSINILQNLETAGIIEHRQHTGIVSNWRFSSARWQEYFASLELRKRVDRSTDVAAAARPGLAGVWRMAAAMASESERLSATARALAPVLEVIVKVAAEDNEVVQPALEMIKRTGPWGIPVMELVAGTPGGTSVQIAVGVLGQEGVSDGVRSAAARALRGTTHQPALEALTGLLSQEGVSDYVRSAIARTLQGTTDRPTLEALTGLLSREGVSDQVRWSAARALGGTTHQPALEALTGLLGTEGPFLRVPLTAALALQGTTHQATLEALIGLLGQEGISDNVRLATALESALRGTTHQPTLEALTRLLNQEGVSVNVRSSAARALGGTAHQPALDALTGILSQEGVSDKFRSAAASALEGTTHEPALEALTGLLGQEDVRLAAALALGGTTYQLALEALTGLLGQEGVSDLVRSTAARALGGTTYQPALEALTGLLGQEDVSHQVRSAAASALEGTVHQPALEYLTGLLDREGVSDQVRWSAARALGGTTHQPALEALTRLLSQERVSDGVRDQAACSLLGTTHQPAFDAAIECLIRRDVTEGVRDASGQILGQAPPGCNVAQLALAFPGFAQTLRGAEVMAGRALSDDLQFQHWNVS